MRLFKHLVLLIAVSPTFVLANTSTAFAEEDVVSPELVSFSFSPTVVDVTSGPANVDVTFEVTDDLSGVDRVEIRFRSLSQAQFEEVFVTSALVGSVTD